MLQTVHSASLLGLDVHRVRVEVAITRGTPMIQIVGLPAGAVREGRERIRAAAAHLDLHVPGLRITVNLAPADVRKEGAGFDLPILVGILAAAGKVPAERAERWGMVGELGLDGSLRPLRGALPLALAFREAADLDGLILPRASLAETRPVADHPVLGAGSLPEVLGFLRRGTELCRAAELPPAASPDPPGRPDLADVAGQETARRALEIAAAGEHNLLLRGEPGAGKTMLARRLPGILPPPTLDEAVEASAVHSIAGRLQPGAGLLRERPFRAPHHSTSEAGLVGGSAPPRPGEVSLAHRGVLFLDELPEFRRRALESLRQPLEDGMVTVVRARAAVTFPARFLLVAAMNPCPCGWLTAGDERCTCDPGEVRRYVRRVSGPLLDRIDLHVDLSAVAWRELRRAGRGEPSRAVRGRVREARERALRRGRAAGDALPVPSGRLTGARLRRDAALDAAGEEILRRAVHGLGLSARAAHRVLRVARTIADLEGDGRIAAAHVAEAVQYRRLDRPVGG